MNFLIDMYQTVGQSLNRRNNMVPEKSYKSMEFWLVIIGVGLYLAKSVFGIDILMLMQNTTSAQDQVKFLVSTLHNSNGANGDSLVYGTILVFTIGRTVLKYIGMSKNTGIPINDIISNIPIKEILAEVIREGKEIKDIQDSIKEEVVSSKRKHTDLLKGEENG